MEKHSSYFKLFEQLKDAGCPVCARAKNSLHGFLDSYLYEGVTDDSNWNRLSAAGGWCARHAGQLAGFSDGLAVSLFYRFEIRKRLQRLGKISSFFGRFFKKKAAVAPCPACVHQAEIEAGLAHSLAKALEDGEFWQAFSRHAGLCLPHGAELLARLKGEMKERYRSLAAAQLEALCAELDEFVKKSDYRNTEKMGTEGGAWLRALERVYGPDFQVTPVEQP